MLESVVTIARGSILCLRRGQRARRSAVGRARYKQMGLSGMAIMSDNESMDVRGMGYGSGPSGYSSAKASGNSFATINLGPLGGAHSENSYSSSGKNVAGGDKPVLRRSFHQLEDQQWRTQAAHGRKMAGYGGKRTADGRQMVDTVAWVVAWGGGTKTTTVTFTVFAGGSSHAYAH